MTSLSNIRIVCTTTRKLVSIETPEFRIAFNGRNNADYTSLFKQLGIDLVFVEPDKPTIADAKVDIT